MIILSKALAKNLSPLTKLCQYFNSFFMHFNVTTDSSNFNIKSLKQATSSEQSDNGTTYCVYWTNEQTKNLTTFLLYS